MVHPVWCHIGVFSFLPFVRCCTWACPGSLAAVMCHCPRMTDLSRSGVGKSCLGVSATSTESCGGNLLIALTMEVSPKSQVTVVHWVKQIALASAFVLFYSLPQKLTHFDPAKMDA